MKSERERMDIIAAYNDLGSFRGAAAICGVDHKTVKRAVLGPAAQSQRQGRPPAQLRRRGRRRRRPGGQDLGPHIGQTPAARGQGRRLHRLGPQLPAPGGQGQAGLARR